LNPVTEDRALLQLLQILRQRNLQLGVAESCTGGLLAAQITAIAGVSDIFRGGVVAYANSVKQNVLMVPESLLIQHGAVSEPVVIAMAKGVAKLVQVDCAIAISGVAGPSGGTPQKPVGMVCIAAVGPGFERGVTQHFQGDRKQIQTQSAVAGIALLLELLNG